MLYFHFSDTTIEVIETQKSLIGQEKIVAVARGEIPEGFIVEGSIQRPEEVKSLLTEILAHAYPKPIKNNHASIIIPDSQIVTRRLGISVDDLKTELKNSLGDDLSLYEHFYKIIGKEDKKEILYTGMRHDYIQKWSNILTTFSLDLTFLTSESFAFLAFLEPILTPSDLLLYCHIHKKIVTYFVYDAEGPRRIWIKKITGKTFAAEVKAQIEKYEKEGTVITKILLGGEGSIEILTEEVKEKAQKETIKVSDVFDTLLANHKIDFITQGDAKMFFLPVIGLLLLTKKENVPNFVKDTAFHEKTIQEKISVKQQDISISPDVQSIGESQKPLLADVQPTNESIPTQPGGSSENISSFIPDSIVEYKRTTFFDFFRGKIFFIVLFFVAILVLLFSIFFIRENKWRNLPFFPAVPTLIPTLTIVPSSTPTPTIDPKLKRSDLKISVENGTTTAGYAKDIAVFLEGKGYKNVGKGNADTDTYQETVIKIKEIKKIYLTLLKVDLVEKVQIALVEVLPDDSAFDVIIRLGANH